MSGSAAQPRIAFQGRQLGDQMREMTMDWGYKAMLTTMTVALVLLVAQSFGRRLAGMLAGLPVITAPALLWITAEQGAGFAAKCAVGSIAACGLMALFALTYERLSRRLGPGLTLIGSLAIGGMVALPMTLLQGHPLRASALSAVLCIAVVLLLPSGGANAGQVRRMRGEIPLTAVAAGLVSVVISLAARELGPFWSGLLAALPIISAAALVTLHLTSAHESIERFLRGYVTGLIGKAVFALTFAVLIVQTGVVVAIAAALLTGISVTFGMTQVLAWLEQRRQVLAAPFGGANARAT
jgi:hypothetical protein